MMKKLGEVTQNELSIKTLLGGSKPPIREVIEFVKQCKIEI